MDLVSFYQNVLCLPSPWYVERVECFTDAKRVDVWIKHRESRLRLSKQVPFQNSNPVPLREIRVDA